MHISDTQTYKWKYGFHNDTRFTKKVELNKTLIDENTWNSFIFLQKVPIDCLVSEWNEWSPHNPSGRSRRERFVTQKNLNGGTECPVLLQTKLGKV